MFFPSVATGSSDSPGCSWPKTPLKRPATLALSVCHKWRPHEYLHWALKEFFGAHFEFLGDLSEDAVESCGQPCPGVGERDRNEERSRGIQLWWRAAKERPGQSGLEVVAGVHTTQSSLGKICDEQLSRGLGLGPALPLRRCFPEPGILPEHLRIPASFPMVGFGLLNSEYFFC